MPYRTILESEKTFAAQAEDVLAATYARVSFEYLSVMKTTLRLSSAVQSGGPKLLKKMNWVRPRAGSNCGGRYSSGSIRIHTHALQKFTV